MRYVTTISAGEPTVAGAAWRYRLIVLVAVLAALAVGLVYAEARPALFNATGTMVLQDPRSGAVFAAATGEPPDRYTGDQVAVLKSPQLAAAAAGVGNRMNPPLGLSADDFSAHTVVTGTPSNGNLVTVAYNGSDAQTSLRAVDAIKTAYEQTVHAAVSAQLSTLLSQIDSELSSINSQLTTVAAELAAPSASNPPGLAQAQTALLARRDTLNAKRDQVVVDAASGSNGVAQYLAPQTATHASRLLSAAPILAVAAALGLIVGLIAAYILASRRRLFRGRDEPEVVLGAPLVAEIPRFHRAHPLPAADGAPAAAASAFRTAAFFIQARQSAGRDAQRRRHQREGVRRMVVLSPARRDGRSTVAANLGVALADSGIKTLLVDADPATGGLADLVLGRLDTRSSNDSLRVSVGAAGMALDDVIRPNPDFRLALLRMGQESGRSLNEADRNSCLLALESAFEVVIIDGPPMSDAGRSWDLVRRGDTALVVVTDSTPVGDLEEVMRMLGAIEMPLFGYVFNHRGPLRRAARPAAKKPSPVSPSAPAPRVTASA